MPKKGSKKEVTDEVEHSEDEFQEEEVENIPCSELKTKRIYFKARKPDQGSTQLMCFPKYLYDTKKKPTSENFEKFGKSFIVVTKPIKMFKGGVPRHKAKYHGPDPDSMKRAYFYIPKGEDDPNSMELFNAIQEIDDWMDEEINVKKNANAVLCYLKKEKRVKLKGITYKRMITTAKGPSTLDLDDEEKPNKKPFVPWDRIKVKLATLYDENLGPNDKKEIVTQVYNGNNEESEKVTTVSDVDEHLVWQCTAQYALMFNKVWIQKNDEQNCGIGIKCIQICITEKPDIKKKPVSTQLSKRLFARSATSNVSNDNDDENDEEDNDEEDNDEEDNDEEDNDEEDNDEAEDANESENEDDAGDESEVEQDDDAEDEDNEDNDGEDNEDEDDDNDASEPESEEEEASKKKKKNIKVKGKNKSSSSGDKKKKKGKKSRN